MDDAGFFEINPSVRQEGKRDGGQCFFEIASDACIQEAGCKDCSFLGTELSGNHVDTVWPYWNLIGLYA